MIVEEIEEGKEFYTKDASERLRNTACLSKANSETVESTVEGNVSAKS